MEPIQQKRYDVAQTIVNVALSMCNTLEQMKPHQQLFAKRIFPDRTTPRRIIRQRKRVAKHEIDLLTLQMLITPAMGAAQVACITSQPIPNYTTGCSDAGIEVGIAPCGN